MIHQFYFIYVLFCVAVFRFKFARAHFVFEADSDENQYVRLCLFETKEKWRNSVCTLGCVCFLAFRQTKSFAFIALKIKKNKRKIKLSEKKN